ncbi:hypothetical protein ACWCQZ_50855 [Streptomyces sp. NPDC002285]
MYMDLNAVVKQAQALYANGSTRTEAARAIFGADLPEEFFAVMAAYSIDGGGSLPIEPMCRAREIYGLADPSHEPYYEDLHWQQQEANALAQHPNIVLLMELGLDQDACHAGWLIGYEKHELRAGRSTVVGIRNGVPEQGAIFTVLGPSLLHVLHEWSSDHLRMKRAQAEIWENRRYGYVTSEDIEHANEVLRLIEKLQ